LTFIWLARKILYMPTKSNRAALELTVEEMQEIKRLSQSQSEPHRTVQRARMLLHYYAGKSFTEIAALVQTPRRIVYKCVDKALEMGVEAGLRDSPHGRQDRVITLEDKAWVVHLACSKPKELGYAVELWTRQALAQHIRKYASAQGHPDLVRAAKATVQRILDEQELQPHKVRYYLERRDPEFEAKMKEVLLVYREIATAPLEGIRTAEGLPVYTVSVDEKPGVQALATTALDLSPVPKKHPRHGRDYEYKRLGTASILAGLDLQDGHVIARVERRHRSREFIQLLRDLDAHYPSGAVIRIILDNHSAHISKETRSYLASHPNRFRYVHTPKHGSWLNLVETLFDKMAHTFLRHIRVESWNELRNRILKGVEEINADPVVHRWKKFDVLDNLGTV
jgi:transposase